MKEIKFSTVNHPDQWWADDYGGVIKFASAVDAKAAERLFNDLSARAEALTTDELNRLRAIEHAAWHAWDSSEERKEGIYVPAQEAIALASLLPEVHPGNDMNSHP